MPNHCANLLRVSGPTPADVRTFQEAAKGFGPAWDGKQNETETALDLNNFVPVPDSILNASRESNGHKYDAYNSGGYDFCVNEWGTKWGCYDIDVQEEEDGKTLAYYFQTAWSPFSNTVLEAMARRFPALTFELKYAEQGCGFVGLVEAAGGEITSQLTENVGGLVADSEIQDLLRNSG